jgi:hypothetical protein
MNNFEYLMVLVSVLLALALAQVLRGLSHLLRSERRHWTSALWGVALFLSMVQFWWALWDTRGIPAWNQLSFLGVLLIPCAFFAVVEILFPSHKAGQTDWREHYFSVRPWFHGTYLTYHLLGIGLTWVLVGVPLTHPYRIAQGLCAAAHVVGLLTARKGVIFWLPIAYLVVLTGSQAYFRLFQTGLMPWPLGSE